VTEAHELAAQMHRAYERGDNYTARLHAQQLLSSAATDESARALLRRTQPDVFLISVGALGLGVLAWLFYVYVL
jgi:hypothetical protein